MVWCKRVMSNAVLLLICGWLTGPQVQLLPSADPSTEQDAEQEVEHEVVASLAEQVLAIQRAKCLDCHGPDSDKRKAKRAYPDGLDLAATVEEWVSPGKPDDSDLYLMLIDGDMPPKDADVAPLTPAELAVYQSWIEAGAPTELPDSEAGGNGSSGGNTSSGSDGSAGGTGAGQVDAEGNPMETEQLPPPGLTEPERMRRFIGRQHPAIVHFPIALVLSAALLEMMIMFRRREGWIHAQRFCLRFGALLSAVSAALGYMLTEFTHTSDELWLHGGLAGAAILCSLNAARSVPADANARRNRFRLWLGAAAVMISATGFMGGYLVFGWDYLKY